MYQQASYAAPIQGAPPAPPTQLGAPTWQWAPAVGAHGYPTAVAQVPPMRARDGVAGLAIGLCVLATALSAGIGFTVRETRTVPQPAAVAPAGDTATPAADNAQPLAADGHAHKH